MTQKRRDDKSTEFGLWLREQKELDSSIGFVATNLDYMWENYNSGQWMLIEEKRYNSKVKTYQTRMFTKIDKSIKDENYKGFHILIFENTNPEDGLMTLDGKIITKEQLIDFLRFKNTENK